MATSVTRRNHGLGAGRLAGPSAGGQRKHLAISGDARRSAADIDGDSKAKAIVNAACIGAANV